MLTFHPLIANDPDAVAILRFQVPSQPLHNDFFEKAQAAARLLQLQTACDVALKPNATAAERFRKPDSGIGTHPGFIWGLTHYLREHGAGNRQIYIVEDPWNVDYSTSPTWQDTGYLEIAAVTGARLDCPRLETCVERAVANPQAAPFRRVSRLAVDPAVALINIPKLKTHNLGITTLCLKNLMGLNYGPERHFCSQAMTEMPVGCSGAALPREQWMDEAMHERWQEGLGRRLADLAQVIQPKLNIVEGIVGRDGTGFQHGTNITLGLVVAGTNMVAVDSVTSYLMGFNPQQLIYLRIAVEAGLGHGQLSNLHCYTNDGDELVACPDISVFRSEPPFVVNRMLKTS